jgi:hypothetical protein
MSGIRRYKPTLEYDINGNVITPDNQIKRQIRTEFAGSLMHLEWLSRNFNIRTNSNVELHNDYIAMAELIKNKGAMALLLEQTVGLDNAEMELKTYEFFQRYDKRYGSDRLSRLYSWLGRRKDGLYNPNKRVIKLRSPTPPSTTAYTAQQGGGQQPAPQAGGQRGGG